MNKTKSMKNLFTALAIFAMIGGIMLPTTIADTGNSIASFDRGVSWKPYVSLKRATFVNFDGETYLDDYAYLASVPTSVFYDKNSDKIYTNPLLYYQDAYPVKDDKERVLDSYPGIKYFMEDWMGYCNGKLDKMTLINLQKNRLDSNWNSKNYSLIEGKDPYNIANKIALNDWSYSDDAVVAVVKEDYEKPVNEINGNLHGSLFPKEILTEHFEIPKTNQVYPIYNEFNVPEGYKLLKVRSWYPSFYIDIKLLAINMSIPAGDRDLQVYCEKDGKWMMAGITNAWNALEGMDKDKTSVYVYNSGKWSVALTDAPTKGSESESVLSTTDLGKTSSDVEKHHSLLGIGFGRYGRIIDILKNMRKVTYQVDVEMYPGVTVDVPDTPPFGCRDAYISLKWNDPLASLGFSLIGPGGEEVLSTRESGVSSTCEITEDETAIPVPSGSETDMYLHQLGECLPGEHYSICVFAINEMDRDVDFTIEYSWQQNISRVEGDCLASATEGAVLASLLNAPLLYTDTSEVSSGTVDALYKLGVKNIFLVDLGGYLSSKANEQLSEVATIQNHFTKYDDIYSHIRKITGKNDVIFSTISPWTYWHSAGVGAVEMAGEMPGALAIGPAAYIAAHHGSPVLIVDNHPELSSAVVWHTEFWRRHPDGLSKLPLVSEMYLTGTRVYNFLKSHGFDQEGQETIITLGGQFEIGLSWDRVFVGKGMSGRFIDSPTDISVWVSKTVFYPQIVFENPAMNSNGVTLINGSTSARRFPWRSKLGLKITKESDEETFVYPVLGTFVCYDHKFNSRASKYWGFTYTCADGTIPGITPSFDAIDVGVMEAVNGQKGGFLPDLSGSEVQPFYLRKAGYEPVFSTSFEANMFDLNAGVLLWLVNTHGSSGDGGRLEFWTAEGDESTISVPFAAYTKETNPWRAYDWLLGSTEEPDTMTMETRGLLPALTGNPTPIGARIFSTGLDWALAKRPIRDIVGKIFNLPILKLFAPTWLKDTQDYYDGIVISLSLSRLGTSWYNGTQIDDALENIHSAGVSSVACLPAGKYLHLTLMRHGSVFQIMDPWATSWYSDVWQNSVPRGIALGKTIGEIYSEGISKVGILYISEPPQWWWDLAENVCLYGDPDLRVWVPSTEYSAMNHWESKDVESLKYDSRDGFSVGGHMPFGVDGYPHEIRKTQMTQQLIILAVVIILITIFVAFYVSRRKRKK